jgi:hypothetical protein
MQITPVAKNEKIFLALLTLAAAFVRYYGYDFEGYWGDEIFILQSFERPLGELMRWIFSEGQMPLFWMFMRLWHGLFGDDRLVLLLPNIIMGALAVPAYWTLARRFPGMGKFGAAAAAILVAVVPLQVRHAQELRMYPMLSLAASITLIEYHRLATVDNVKLRRMIIAGLVLGLVHPIASLLLAAMFIATLVGYRNFRGRMFKLLCAFAAIGFPLLAIAVYAASMRNISNLISLLGSRPLDGISNVVFLFGPGFANPPPQTAIAIFATAAIAFIFFLLGLRKPTPDADRFFERLLLVFCAICLLASFRMPVFTHPRYILFSQVLIIPFIARGLASIGYRKPACLILCAFAATAMFVNYSATVHIGQPQWREAAKHIDEKYILGETVILFSISEESPFPFYYRRNNLLAQPNLIGSLMNYSKNARGIKTADAQMNFLVRTKRGIWLVKDQFMMSVAEKFADVQENFGKSDLKRQSQMIRNLPVVYQRWDTLFRKSYPQVSTTTFEFITITHYSRPD